MKVYVIKASRRGFETYYWYVYQIYSSKEKAMEVYKSLSSLDPSRVYCICEYDVID